MVVVVVVMEVVVVMVFVRVMVIGGGGDVSHISGIGAGGRVAITVAVCS